MSWEWEHIGLKHIRCWGGFVLNDLLIISSCSSKSLLELHFINQKFWDSETLRGNPSTYVRLMCVRFVRRKPFIYAWLKITYHHVIEISLSVPALSLQVCGSDGKTYRNECELKNTKCLEKRLLLIQSQGPCAGRCFTHKHIQWLQVTLSSLSLPSHFSTHSLHWRVISPPNIILTSSLLSLLCQPSRQNLMKWCR